MYLVLDWSDMIFIFHFHFLLRYSWPMMYPYTWSQPKGREVWWCISKRILQVNYFKCMKNKSIPWVKGNIISPKGWFLNEKPIFMWVLKALNWRESSIIVSRHTHSECTISQEKYPWRGHLSRIGALFKNRKIARLSIILPQITTTTKNCQD